MIGSKNSVMLLLCSVFVFGLSFSVAPPVTAGLGFVPRQRSKAEIVETDEAEEICTQIPQANGYSCEKDEYVERSYNCDTETEREICEYAEEELKEDCYRLRKEIIQYPCFKSKKEKTCWKVPIQKSKKCKKTVKKQTEIPSERTVRREQCKQISYEVDSQCYRLDEQTMAYMCYRPQQTVCKDVEVTTKTTCEETKMQRQPYKCERTVYETRCEQQASSNQNFFYSTKRHEPICREVAIHKSDTCYRESAVKVSRPCEKVVVQKICKTPEPVPETCEKKIPSLREYACKSIRHREECPVVELIEKTKDYVYHESEMTFDCPYIEDAESCVVYETVVSDVCEKEVQKVEKFSCPLLWHKEICQVKSVISPHTCYAVDTIKHQKTCYEVEYEKVCAEKAMVEDAEVMTLSAKA